MATKIWAALLVLFTTLLTSSAQIFYKLGSQTLVLRELSAIFTNYYLIGGLLLYAVGGTLMILSLRGGEVSVLYPIMATSYIWVSFLSTRFLGEAMNGFKWLGIASIMAGIVLIGFGSKETVPGAM